jgi:N-acetylglucosaminyldiphosphoundecaprenol N-acetyl-beta-D-mannosaminyltransferase
MIMKAPLPPTRRCLGVRLWAEGFTSAIEDLVDAAHAGRKGYACFANAHMIGETQRNRELHQAMLAASWVFPDGKPVQVVLRLRGAQRAGRVPGPDAAEALMARAVHEHLPIYLFGGTENVLANLQKMLPERYPGLVIAGAHSPPFRKWTREEEAADAERIRASGANICFVALGCPKQEIWMRRNSENTGCVCLGVGAAFPIMAGITPRSPRLISHLGGEWLYRWAQEPRRLSMRYTTGNVRFALAIWREMRQMRPRNKNQKNH